MRSPAQLAHPLKVGLKYAPLGASAAQLREVWQIADQGGFDHLWTFDHMISLVRGPRRSVFEGWVLLGAMAEATSRVRVGCLVTANTFRHPGLLAKMAVTVDHLSGGRLEMGIGAGWAEAEHRMLGIESGGSPGRRIAWLREACLVLKALWTMPEATFSGERYRLQRAIAEPKPLQSPHPPIWIGGRGEIKTLRVVAELADVWNVDGAGPAEAARLSAVLDGHCAALGRDPRAIRRSASLLYGGDVKGTVGVAAAYLASGFTELIVTVSGATAPALAASAAEQVLPAIRGLEV